MRGKLEICPVKGCFPVMRFFTYVYVRTSRSLTRIEHTYVNVHKKTYVRVNRKGVLYEQEVVYCVIITDASFYLCLFFEDISKSIVSIFMKVCEKVCQ